MTRVAFSKTFALFYPLLTAKCAFGPGCFSLLARGFNPVKICPKLEMHPLNPAAIDEMRGGLYT